MPLNVTCPHCSKGLKVKEEYAGKRVKCPGCAQPFLLDESTYQAAAPAPAFQVASTSAPVVKPAPKPAPGLMGKLACKLGGHQYTKCRCERCGAVRDEEHQWTGSRCRVCDKTGSVDEALVALKATDVNSRLNALQWLAELGGGAAQAMPLLVKIAGSDPDPKIQAAAVRAQIDMVGAGLNNPAVPQNSRVEMAKSLGAMKHPRAVDQLVQALDSLGPEYHHPTYVLFAIVEALKQQGDQQAAPALQRALTVHEQAQANGGFHFRRFISDCRDALKKVTGGYSEADVLGDELLALWVKGHNCDATARKLKAVADPKCIPALLDKFSPYCSAGTTACYRAARVLAHLGDWVKEPLSAALSSERENIREIASDTLAEIERNKGKV